MALRIRTGFVEGGAVALDRAHVRKLRRAALRFDQSGVVVGQGSHRLGGRRARLLLRGGVERGGEVREVTIEGGLGVFVIPLPRLQGLLGLACGDAARVETIRPVDRGACPGRRGGGRDGAGGGASGGGGSRGAARYGDARRQRQGDGGKNADSAVSHGP